MKAKTFFISLIILAVFSFSAQGLVFKHDKAKHQIYHQAISKIGNSHMQGADISDMPPELINKLVTFLEEPQNKDLADAITNDKQLTMDQQSRLMNFFNSDPRYSEYLNRP